MSALCAYTQYIACIGLFKHCKRIHSTESYFQKVALCIIYIYFLFFFSLTLNGRSCVSVCVCWLLVGLLLFVFRKHGRPCDTTWLGTDKRLTNAVARQTHPYLRRGWTECYVYRTLQIASTTARVLIGWVNRARPSSEDAAENRRKP